MVIRNKLYLTFGLAAVLGLIGSTGVLFAGDEQKEAEPSAEVLESWGADEVVANDPHDAMFTHQTHVVDLGLDCDACHPDTFEKKRGSALAKGDFTMASMEEGMYCGACHNGDMAFGVKEPDSCATCHGSDITPPKTVVFKLPVKAVIFNHELHTGDLGLECSSCHSALFKMKVGTAEQNPEAFTMAALYAGKYCGACHNGDDAFASNTKCTTCHIGVKGFERLYGKAKSEAGAHH